MNTLTIFKKDRKEYVQMPSLKELFELAIMNSFKYDVEIINDHTGEVHFYCYGGESYMSSDMRLVLLRCL